MEVDRARLQGQRRRARSPIPTLQEALGQARRPASSERPRAQAAERLPEFEALRDRARDIKDHTLANLDLYLEEFERKVTRARRPGPLGARRRRGARASSLELCQRGGRAHGRPSARSMSPRRSASTNTSRRTASQPVETDLGEYIIQLAPRAAEPHHRAGGPPDQGPGRRPVRSSITRRPRQRLTERTDLVAEARQRAARAASSPPTSASPAPTSWSPRPARRSLVTNEGNADLTNTLPRMHIVSPASRRWSRRRGRRHAAARAGALGDRPGVLGLHHASSPARKRAGRPRRARAAIHVVLLDNGRTRMLGTELQDMLRCIRCGACMNHCPVYLARSAATPMAGSIPGRWARC